MYGRPKEQVQHDDRLEDGPIKERQTTDVIFCLAFLGFWAFSLFLFFTTKGDFSKILRPSDGIRDCGVDATKGYDNLFFNLDFSIATAFNAETIMENAYCVKSCQNSGSAWKSDDCFIAAEDPRKGRVSDCANLKTYTTTKAARFCLPSLGANLKKIADAFNHSNNIEIVVSSLKTTSTLIWGSIIFSFLFSFFFSWLLEHCPGVVVAVSLIGFYVGAGYMGYLSLKNFNSISPDEEDPILKGKRRFFQISMFAIFSTLAIVSCLICCFWSQLVLATKIIGAAAEFVSDTKRIVLVPIFMLVLVAGYVIFWGYSTAFIFSSGELEPYPTGGDWLSKPYRSIQPDEGLKKKMWTNGFGLFWNVAFLLTLSNFIINGVVCFWYHNTTSRTKSPISTTLWWAFRYHLGTLAFGSFILAVIWVLRVIAEYLYKKQQEQKKAGLDSKLATFLICCMRCVLAICEKLIKFINRHSYTEVIMRGTNFCSSARQAIALVTKNLTRFTILHGLGAVVMNFARLFIIFVTLVGSYYVLVLGYNLNEEAEKAASMNSMGPPLIVIFLIALSVSSLFAHIWETGSDVILHCYCLDESIQSKRGSRQARHATGKMHEVVSQAKGTGGAKDDDSYGYL